MKTKITLSLYFLLACSGLGAQTYITHVNVADVAKHQWVPNQTVVMTKDIITMVKGSGKIKVPAGATVIDGTGKYLIPGLTDAHVHFFQNGGLYTRPDAMDLRDKMPYAQEIAVSHQTMEDKLRRYMQNGITNVIDVGATVHFLKQRRDFKEAAYAPSIYMTGPLLTTYEPEAFKNLKEDEPFNLVKTIGNGIKMVQEQLPHRPDFIKIWYITSRNQDSVEISARKNQPIIKAIITEAHKYHLKVAVHATERITAQLAVESGCDFLVHSVDDEVIKPNFIQLLQQHKTILCPTLVVYDGYADTFGQSLHFGAHDFATANPYQLGSLLDLKHLPDTLMINGLKKHFNTKAGRANVTLSDSISKINLKKLVDAGVPIATGTDAGNIGTLHASSYLEEVKAMQQSGMTPWQILESSTLNGAKVLGKESEFGSISIGKKANLVLLDKSPTDNIENLTTIAKVINKGVAFSPSELLQDSPADLVQNN